MQGMVIEKKKSSFLHCRMTASQLQNLINEHASRVGS